MFLDDKIFGFPKETTAFPLETKRCMHGESPRQNTNGNIQKGGGVTLPASSRQRAYGQLLQRGPHYDHRRNEGGPGATLDEQEGGGSEKGSPAQGESPRKRGWQGGEGTRLTLLSNR